MRVSFKNGCSSVVNLSNAHRHGSLVSAFLGAMVLTACGGKSGFLGGQTARKGAAPVQGPKKADASQDAASQGAASQVPAVQNAEKPDASEQQKTPDGKVVPKAGVVMDGVVKGAPIADSPVAAAPRTETFTILAPTNKLDILWVVDNSAVMYDKIAKVEANFAAFAQRVAGDLGQSGALRLGLFSVTEYNNTLVPGFNPSKLAAFNLTKHLDVAPSGSTALDFAAMSLCPASSSKAPTGHFAAGSSARICGNQVPIPMYRGTAYGKEESIPGAFQSFLRKDARLALVFVTDGDANNVTSANFLDLLKAGGVYQPVVFTFGALTPRIDGAACSVYKKSESYISLANSTGGAAFDICADNWTPHFDTIAKKTVSAARLSWKLAVPANSIVKVTVDGMPLPEGASTVSGDIFAIKEGALPAGAKSLQVTYAPTQM